RGRRVQVARTDVKPPPDAVAREVALVPERPLAIVTTHAAPLIARFPGSVALSDTAGDLRQLVRRGTILIGEVEEWQSRWGALASLRSVAEIIFDGCSAADYRALTRSRLLPPPISAGVCWRFNEDGTASRVRLPPSVM
ncbi:MAG: cell division protein, partial [Rhodoglobus sp.]|nr:cell division protein [Rhodoglobus sp.]